MRRLQSEKEKGALQLSIPFGWKNVKENKANHSDSNVERIPPPATETPVTSPESSPQSPTDSTCIIPTSPDSPDPKTTMNSLFYSVPILIEVIDDTGQPSRSAKDPSNEKGEDLYDEKGKKAELLESGSQLEGISEVSSLSRPRTPRRRPLINLDHPMLTWTPKDVKSWLDSIGIRDAVSQIFLDRHISGLALSSLSDSDLQYDLGIESYNTRTTILISVDDMIEDPAAAKEFTAAYCEAMEKPPEIGDDSDGDEMGPEVRRPDSPDSMELPPPYVAEGEVASRTDGVVVGDEESQV
ncbi:hypothetical protein HDU97_003929 [Phlyctochytrium planicorne]|nr:hypothetical protein HDU97_003929 [Phlyctochytrium planicorne]